MFIEGFPGCVLSDRRDCFQDFPVPGSTVDREPPLQASTETNGDHIQRSVRIEAAHSSSEDAPGVLHESTKMQMQKTFLSPTYSLKMLCSASDGAYTAWNTESCSTRDLQHKILVKAKRRFDNEDSVEVHRKLTITPIISTEQNELALLEDEVRKRQLCPEEEEISSKDLSKIVNYLTADKVPHTWNVDPRLFLMCSMSEDASMKVYRDFPQRQANKLVKHTSKRLVRVFPANMRIKSDNYLPNVCSGYFDLKRLMRGMRFVML
ncbi:hypothetical protein ANCCEY_06245 [Ancylostoma ceylanicum]|uniref:phosphoinositide phospholipase C n=1 Tax=Ancylostoma ceylanicum TaxID=53326 RepID=A0A0D6M428_9BILA|nr:hypothetical protein ANCCEY_06245 [Ancylostoma ceylanicum]